MQLAFPEDPHAPVLVQTGAGHISFISARAARHHRDKFEAGEWTLLTQAQAPALPGVPPHPAIPGSNPITSPSYTSADSTPLFIPRPLHQRPVVLHIFSFPARQGGIVGFISSLAASMPDVDYYLLCTFNNKLDTDNITSIPWIKGIYAARNEGDALRYVDDLSPDAFICHYPSRSWVYAQRPSIPVVHIQHSWATNSNPGKMVAGQIPIAGPHPDKIAHGVDLDTFSPADRAPRRKKGEIVLGISGRLADEKTPKKFMEWVKARPKNVKIRVAGCAYFEHHRQYEDGLKTAGCEMLGELPRDAMPDFYRSIDALIMPSAEECCPVAAIEALACGVPVIGRNVGGLSEVIGDAGFLYSEESELDAILKTPLAKFRKLGAVARQRAVDLFDADRMAAAYRRVLSQRTGGLIQPLADVDASWAITAYNTRPEWLRECLDSVLNQEGPTAEVVLIDDGSTDPATRKTMREYSMDPRVRLIRTANQGVALGHRESIGHCHSDLVLKIDSDDCALPGRLAAQVEFMAAHPEIALMGGQIQTDGETYTLKFDNGRWPWRQGWGIAHPTVCKRRYQALLVGCYTGEYLHGEDFDLWCRLAACGGIFHVTEQKLTYYRQHAGQITQMHGDHLADVRRRIIAHFEASVPGDKPHGN